MRDAFRRSRLLALLLLAPLGALALPPVGADEEENSKVGRKYALVVGVRNYKKDELRPLEYADKDAAALASALRGAGYRRVVLMTYASAADDADALPTVRNIKEQLRGLIEDCRKEDTVVFAFTGHGAQFAGGKEHYLCPIDAELGEKDTLLPLTDVYKELEGCKAGTRLVVIDACHARPQTGASVRLEARPRPQDLEVPRGVLALFSCSAGQSSFESERLKQGIFYHYLLKGLGGAAASKDGPVTLEGLVKYVQDEVPDAAKEDAGPSARQVPLLRGEGTSKVALLFPPGTFTPSRGKGTLVINSIGMQLAAIPPGKFLMGSPVDEPSRNLDEAPEREVEITRPFLMGAYEVTQAEYQKVMGTNPSYFSLSGGGSGKMAGMDAGRHPVERVNWQEAVELCKKLSALPAEKRAGRTYRLPTEAEWEYACRAGTRTAFSFGASASSTQANFDGDFPYHGGARGPDLVRTTRVGSYPPNAWGLYDMHGNVAEWCADHYDRDAYRAGAGRDPQGPERGTSRVLRGGSWTNVGHNCRAARRASDNPTNRANTAGLRVVCVVGR